MSSGTARSQHSSNRDLVNLKTVFRKYDAAKKGYLEHGEFKKLLASLRIDVSSNDMYMIAADFDPDLRGVFDYEMFLKAIIHAVVVWEKTLPRFKTTKEKDINYIIIIFCNKKLLNRQQSSHINKK